jgi:hypothetical protein
MGIEALYEHGQKTTGFVVPSLDKTNCVLFMVFEKTSSNSKVW